MTESTSPDLSGYCRNGDASQIQDYDAWAGGPITAAAMGIGYYRSDSSQLMVDAESASGAVTGGYVGAWQTDEVHDKYYSFVGYKCDTEFLAESDDVDGDMLVNGIEECSGNDYCYAFELVTELNDEGESTVQRYALCGGDDAIKYTGNANDILFHKGCPPTDQAWIEAAKEALVSEIDGSQDYCVPTSELPLDLKSGDPLYELSCLAEVEEEVADLNTVLAASSDYCITDAEAAGFDASLDCAATPAPTDAGDGGADGGADDDDDDDDDDDGDDGDDDDDDDGIDAGDIMQYLLYAGIAIIAIIVLVVVLGILL